MLPQEAVGGPVFGCWLMSFHSDPSLDQSPYSHRVHAMDVPFGFTLCRLARLLLWLSVIPVIECSWGGSRRRMAPGARAVIVVVCGEGIGQAMVAIWLGSPAGMDGRDMRNLLLNAPAMIAAEFTGSRTKFTYQLFRITF
ncbi:hypothetical protein [Mycobacterium marinum]|uniref:hypothetical protein n=1 Tax=Mycobacterium marinum TaxID=1781 RepID=UPI001FB614F3|nr:hypothetical protein [Mycobacterium marinum]MDC8997383.1 hypothetical protein [Mycobacterium marinum]WDZ13979.1 hypothetical protein PQR73_026000 [Mycobacterium marinum]